MLSDIKQGLELVWHDRIVLWLLALSLVTGLLTAPFDQLLPVFVVDVYHRESEALGLMMSVMGGGVVAGSLAIAILGEGRRGLLMIVGSILGSVAMLAIALIPSYFVAAGIMLIFGLGLGGRNVLFQVLVLERVDDQYRGRIMSIMIFSHGLVPLVVLPAGVAVDLVGIQSTVGFLAGGLLVLSSLVLAGQNGLRNLR
jgi:MFS family permease